jgi:hypothetical protein
MNKLATSLAVALATLLVASCGTSTTTSYCPDLFTDTVLPEPTYYPGQNWNVTYTVLATGGAPVNSIQYRNSLGTLVTVNNPALPWTMTLLQVPPGTRITLIASAVAPPGTVTVDALASILVAGGGESKHWLDSCGDMPMQ